MHTRFVLGFALVLALGCGGSKRVAPVAGKVTMDGKPLANATVTFQPIAEQGAIDAGVGSVGKTNAQGEFTLEASNGKTGALVGEHRVSIAVLNEKRGSSDERPPRGGWPLVNQVPDRYNQGGKDELKFTVPADGTDKADFPLKSR
jgi:hypothetical protein